MEKHYYNEFDKEAAAWLRDLMDADLIPKGDVDERSIVEVRASELVGYSRCHFFAGVGGWPLALSLAGVPDWWPLWTGSAPCQPFSQAGKQKAQDDERHLWPVWFGLVRQRKPPVIFGEQVANSIGHGWLDDLQNDMEGEGYALGKAVLGAFSVRSPHLRKRLYFVAESDGSGQAEERGNYAEMRGVPKAERQPEHGPLVSFGSGEFSLLADSQGTEQQGRIPEEGWLVRHSESGELGNNNNQGLEGRSLLSGDGGSKLASGQTGSPLQLANSQDSDGGLPVREGSRHDLLESGRGSQTSVVDHADGVGRQPESGFGRVFGESVSSPEPFLQCGLGRETSGFWDDAKWIWCRDNKFRPTEPVTFPLAYGLPRSLGTMPEDIRKLAEVAGLSQQDLRGAKTFRKSSLRGWGNAIVPQVAAVFIQAYYESIKRTKS